MRARSLVFPYVRAAARSSVDSLQSTMLGLFGAYDSIWLLKVLDFAGGLDGVYQEHTEQQQHGIA